MKGKDYCVPDKTTYNKIQQLKSFVEFVASLPETSNEDKIVSNEIITIIENIDKREKVKDWSASVTLYHKDYPNVQGYCLRNWSVYFELGFFEIEAETRHSDYHLGHHGPDFHYYGYIYLCNRPNVTENWPENTLLNDFLNDARNFRKYINEEFNIIEVSFDIWKLP